MEYRNTNHLGITKDQLFLRMKDEDWDDVIETNLNGLFRVTKAFIKPMVKNKFGRVINISSVAGLMGNSGQVNYSSSKSAMVGFSRSLQELKPDLILIHLHKGAIDPYDQNLRQKNNK